MGAAALSLRGIAREMRLTAPALYRYYQDHDALVTARLVDAFTTFSNALETGRFRAMCKAYFEWASQNPQRYTLLFCTPEALKLSFGFDMGAGSCCVNAKKLCSKDMIFISWLAD
jgi:AcrR family transcriptional regulator